MTEQQKQPSDNVEASGSSIAFQAISFISNLKSQVVTALEKYVEQRGISESFLFVQAEKNHQVIKQEIQTRLRSKVISHDLGDFDKLFSRKDQGVMVNREPFDGSRNSGVYVGQNVEIDAAIANRVLTFCEVLQQYGPCWQHVYQNLYVSLPENAMVIYWPEQPDWAQIAAKEGLNLPAEEYVWVATKENNPERKSVWTGLFHDHVADAWMVSIATPIDDDQGNHIGTIGTDILLTDFMKNVLRDVDVPGTYNFVIRGDGRLIAHRDLLETIKENDGYYNIKERFSETETGAEIAIILQALEENSDSNLLEINAINRVAAVTKIKGPDWFYITVYDTHSLHDMSVSIDEKAKEVNRYSSMLEEILERRTLELAKAETQFKAIYENAREAIFVLDENDVIQLINPAAIEIFGLPDALDDYVGRNLQEIFKTRKTSRAIMKQMATLRKGADKAAIKEIEIVADLTVSLHAELSISEIDYDDGQFCVLMIRDITQRKIAQTKLSEVQKQLIDTAHRAGMADSATAVLHNVGNVLNSVSVSTERIVEVLAADRISGLRKSNRLIEKNAADLGAFFSGAKGQKLMTFLGNLNVALDSDLSEIAAEANNLKLKTRIMSEVIEAQQGHASLGINFVEEFEIQDIVNDAVSLTRHHIDQLKIDLNLNIPERCLINAHKRKLLQVITNLLKNAIEALAMADQDDTSRQLAVTCEKTEDKQVLISIVDNGQGIDKRDLDKIFNHGFTTKKSGHGFGLHSSANFMTEMNGKISVHSDGLGSGATFSLTLPMLA